MKTAGPLLLASGVVLAPAASAQEPMQPMQPSGVAQAMMSDDVDNFFETAASSNMFELQASKRATARGADPKV